MGNRSKKPRKSKYIDDEAEKSGDDHSADECDHIGKEIDNFDYEDGFLVRDDEEVEFEEGKKKRKKVRLSEEEMRVTQDDLDLVREAKEAQEKKGLKRVTQDRRDDESDEESDSMDDFIDDHLYIGYLDGLNVGCAWDDEKAKQVKVDIIVIR